MKTKLFLFLSMLISISSFADDCPTGNVVLANQAEVDAFVAQYPNCTEIDGDLTIGNTAFNGDITDIDDISGLNNIVSVNNLRLQLTSLTSIDSFNSLTTANDISILANPSLASVSGFTNLSTIETININSNSLINSISGFNAVENLNRLDILQNPALTSITGFSNLENIEVILNFSDLNQLNNISGLANLESVGALQILGTQLTNLSVFNDLTIELPPNGSIGNFRIQNNSLLTSLANFNFVGPRTETIIFNNPLLTDLTGLENLTKSNILIENNAGLTSLNGLQGLQESNKWVPNTVGLRVINNQNLTNLDALSNLEDLDDLDIQVTNNANLTDISGLDNVSISTINQLNVSGNTNLATCGSALVCEYIYVNDNNGLTFSNNGAECNSKEDAEANCADILEGLCPKGNLFFTTDAQIARFGEFYTNCTEVENLTVIAPDGTTDLSMFDNLVTVNGMLRIGTTNGTSLSGFHNVENVGFLWITSSPLMESLDVLGNVQGTVTKLEITNCTQLTTVSNFGTFELNDLEVRGNSSLTNLNFLNEVSLVAGEYFAFGPNGNTLGFYAPTLNITNNHSLTSLDGLNVPNSLFNIFLSGHQLNDLSALNTLENLDHAFALFNTEEVENLDFLSGLTTFTVGQIYIGENQALENLDGLDGVMGDFDNTNFIEISENPNLATCESSFICAIVDEFEAGGGGDGAALVGGSEAEVFGGNILFIYDNAEGCNSVEEIESACETFSTELFLTSDVSIYPNPFSNQLTIQLPEFAGTSKVSLVDVSGRVLVQQDILHIGQITGLDELAKGLYFVKITSEDGQSITQKLIK